MRICPTIITFLDVCRISSIAIQICKSYTRGSIAVAECLLAQIVADIRIELSHGSSRGYWLPHQETSLGEIVSTSIIFRDMSLIDQG